MYNKRQRLEDHHYYTDYRVLAIDQSSYLEVNEDNMIADVIINDENIGKVHVSYEVCPTCRGKGKHVNPNIDAHGIPAEEFYGNPRFEHDYKSGMYDVSCNECNGERVVPRPNPMGEDEKDVFDRFQEHLNALRERRAERAAERSMGA